MTSLTPLTFARQSKYPTSNPATMAAVLRISLRPRRCSTAQCRPQTLLAPVGPCAGHGLPGSKINQSEKSRRGVPAGGSGGVSALRQWRGRQRGERRLLLATKAPPRPPQRWRPRGKGGKQINMTNCTTASTAPLVLGGAGPSDVHSSCSRATSDPVAFQSKTRDPIGFHSSV